MSTGMKLVKTINDHFELPTLYRSTIGALQYVTISRPDIAYTVSKLSQYMDTPSKTHWLACKRLLRFLKGTVEHGLYFKPGDIKDLVALTDVDWGCDLNDRKSIGGFCVFYGGNLVSWSSKKQSVVSRSSTELEYRSLSTTAAELAWFASLLKELQAPTPRTPFI